MWCKKIEYTHDFVCGDFFTTNNIVNPFCEIFINNNFINIVETNEFLQYKWTFVLDVDNIVETEYGNYSQPFNNYPSSNFNSLSLNNNYQNLKQFLNTKGYNLLNNNTNINVFCTTKNQINKIKKSNIITITV